VKPGLAPGDAELASLQFEMAATDLSESVASRWRGYVDRWDPEIGMYGWALGYDTPLDSVRVELIVGSTAIDSVETCEARTDVDEVLGVRTLAGFRFGPELYARLAHLKPQRRHLRVNARIANTQVVLIQPDRPPTVGELVASWRAAVLERLQKRDPIVPREERLMARLALLRTQAEGFRELPLRPTADNEIGQIETMHLASGGLLWITGWVMRDTPTELAAMIVDRQKYAAGAALLKYQRQDLSSRQAAFVGVLETGWVPPAIVKEFFIYCGQDARRQLRVSSSTRLVGLEDFLAIYRQAEALTMDGSADVLGSILTSSSSWVPGNAAAAGIAAAASIDRLLMLPGFGCIAEGWAVSPARRVATFQMKVGDCVLVADETCTYFRSRPDLSSVFGGGASIVSRAGFVTVLRGAITGSASGAPLLRVIHEDGTAFVQRLEPKVLHQLDCISDSREVLRLFPSFRHERFYPALLASLRRQLCERIRPAAAFCAAPASRVIVMRLPTQKSNQRLCFDRIVRLNHLNEPAIGVCLIADRGEGLTEAKLLFEELGSAVARPLSLFFVEDATDGFNALPFVLSQLQADRFVYVDSGVMLTPRGWQQAVRALAAYGQGVSFFEIVDDVGEPDRINGALSAACFGWTSAALYGWVSSAPRFLRGVFGTNGLPEPRADNQVVAAAAIRIEHRQPSRFADMIDEDLFAWQPAAQPPIYA
jgi:hypothetical protein